MQITLTEAIARRIAPRRPRPAVERHSPRAFQADESGLVLLFWAFAMLGIFAFLVIVVDSGFVFTQKRELQNAADAAVLAGAQDLLTDEATAVSAALDWAARNEGGLVINSASVDASGLYLTADVGKNAAALLPGNELSFGEPLVKATATARIAAPVWPGSGPIPCAVAASAYFDGAAQNSEDITLMCGGAFVAQVGPGCGVVDISVIGDVSYSIVQANAMNDLRSFTHDLVDAFTLNVGEGAMIGITAFAENSVSVIGMADDAGAIHNAINNNLRYGPLRFAHFAAGPGWHQDYRPSGYSWGQTGMYTDLVDALQGGADQYTNGVADRDFAPNVIVIITDAEDTEGHDLSDIVNLRNAILQAGANGSPNGSEVIIAVGVGDRNDAVLDAIATGGHVYSTASWDGLRFLLDDIAADVCSFAEPPPNPAPSAPVNFGGMSPADFYDAALYGGTVPTSGVVSAAGEANYISLVNGLRQRMALAQGQGCYSWSQVQPQGDDFPCGPLHLAAQNDGLQPTTLLLVPLAVDAGDPDLAGGTIQLLQQSSGLFVFGLFWVDAAQTFENGTGACLSGDDATCQIRGRFLFNTPPFLATAADFDEIELVDFDGVSPVVVVQLVH